MDYFDLLKTFLLTLLKPFDRLRSMKLNIKKIDMELKRIGKSRYWLSQQIGKPPQIIYYWFRAESVRGAEPIAKVLMMEPKDLIK